MVMREGEVKRIQAEGVPVGLLPDREYDEVTFAAREGDVMVLFSDGVSDHMSPDGDEYGRGRLVEVLRRCQNVAPSAIVAEVFDSLDRFNLERFDDQTLIVLKVT